MSNFLKEIEDRLARAMDCKNEMELDINLLQKEIMALRMILHVEEQKDGQRVPQIGVPPTIDPNMSPSDFILEKMANGEVWKTTDLRDAAFKAGLLHGNAAPGRSTHGALIGLLKGGKVKQAGKSQWIKT